MSKKRSVKDPLALCCLLLAAYDSDSYALQAVTITLLSHRREECRARVLSALGGREFKSARWGGERSELKALSGGVALGHGREECRALVLSAFGRW